MYVKPLYYRVEPLSNTDTFEIDPCRVLRHKGFLVILAVGMVMSIQHMMIPYFVAMVCYEV